MKNVQKFNLFLEKLYISFRIFFWVIAIMTLVVAVIVNLLNGEWILAIFLLWNLIFLQNIIDKQIER